MYIDRFSRKYKNKCIVKIRKNGDMLKILELFKEEDNILSSYFDNIKEKDPIKY